MSDYNNVERQFHPLQFLSIVCVVWLNQLVPVDAQATDPDTDFASVVDCTFISEHDGTQQKYVVMSPHGLRPDDPVSILIALHGHGADRWQFVRQSRDECRATRDVAAEHGMVLVSPDYRAKTSWMGPAAEVDLLQIIGILRKQFSVKRLILCGGSMGGTAVLTFTALHPTQVDGVVSLNGTANLMQYDRFQDAISDSFGGTKQQIPEEYHKRSAEFSAGSFTMPFAATTGGKDEIVPAASVLRLIKTVRQRNPRVLSLHRPDGGHETDYADTTQALRFVLNAD